MRFVKAVWKLLVGIKDALVLILMLMFFGLLYAGLSARPAAIGEGVLAMDLDGVLVEQAARPDPLASLAGGSMTTEHELRDLVATLRAARDDDKVKAVALDLDGFLGGGQASISELGQALDAFRKGGKPVVAYATGYTNDRYQLAAHASEVWMPEMGAVGVTGPGGTGLYYKGLLDRLGVTANIYRVGTYKAAVEPFTRSDMSPEARENSAALAGALLETYREDVVRGRPQAAAGLQRLLADPVGMARAAGNDFSRAALDAKLIDRVGTRRAYEERLAELGGDDDDGGYKKVRLAAYQAQAVKHDDGPIGVVTIAGTIVDGRAGPGSAGGETIARAIRKGLTNDGIKALVVRVDSPGGSAVASEEIRQALLAAKARKLPIVVSMGSVAASGGYWVATPADFVFAEPGTVTGSIGVFGILPSFQGTLAKIGVAADGVKTSPLSGEPDLLRGPSPEANALIQAGVEQTYGKFLTIVAASRKKTPAEIDRVAQGRVWDGGTARQLGLVDGFGGMDAAIAKAADLAKLGEDDRGLTYFEEGPGTWDSLFEAFAEPEEQEATDADAFAALAPVPETLLARVMSDVRMILSGPVVQVRCLDCPPVAGARLTREDRGWLETLLRL